MSNFPLASLSLFFASLFGILCSTFSHKTATFDIEKQKRRCFYWRAHAHFTALRNVSWQIKWCVGVWWMRASAFEIVVIKCRTDWTILCHTHRLSFSCSHALCVYKVAEWFSDVTVIKRAIIKRSERPALPGLHANTINCLRAVTKLLVCIFRRLTGANYSIFNLYRQIPTCHSMENEILIISE